MTPNLKTSLLDLISVFHRGKSRAITVSEICSTSDFETVNERMIRKMIRELNFDGHPILTSTNGKMGVYYAESREEINEYLANLGARMKALLERMKAVDRIQAMEILKGQLELFS